MAKHAGTEEGKEDVWMVIGNMNNGGPKVYDVSAYLDDHPGGKEVMTDLAGKNADVMFEDIGHSNEARKIMKKYLVGELHMTVRALPERRPLLLPLLLLLLLLLLLALLLTRLLCMEHLPPDVHAYYATAPAGGGEGRGRGRGREAGSWGRGRDDADTHHLHRHSRVRVPEKGGQDMIPGCLRRGRGGGWV